MLNSIFPQILVALVTAILTAAVTLTSVFLTNLNQRKVEEAKFKRNNEAARANLKREKLEELYLLFSKWDADMMSLVFSYLQVITGKIREEDALVGASKNQMSEKDFLQRITMMINLYFPEIKNDFDGVLDARESIWAFCNESIRPGVGVEDFIRTEEVLRKAAKDFKQKMAGLSNAS